jgi:ketosteroid isomerase-like protein
MDTNLAKDIVSQEEALALATRQLDLDTLDRLYANDILFTGVTGATCGKSSLMDEARRGKAERAAAADTKHFVASYDKDDVKVVRHGDMAVASYRFVVTIHNNGQDARRGYRTTNVWMKRAEGWQVVAGHTSSLESVPA